MAQGRIPETTLRCIQHLRRVHSNSTISVEVEKPGREGLTELANVADVVFYSRGWAEVGKSLASFTALAVTPASPFFSSPSSCTPVAWHTSKYRIGRELP